MCSPEFELTSTSHDLKLPQMSYLCINHLCKNVTFVSTLSSKL